jgi:cytosine/adenosine deaminase-related metal-dependent hydrolase
MANPIVSKLPIEVELVFEVMPCLSMRQTYDSASTPHPCSYFAEWGHYHSYGYANGGPPEQPTINLPVVYSGKRQVVPELLSGCRKAPILCVGINPNLPGWTKRTRNAIHPYFDDVLQYAHYFRYRTRDKLCIPRSDYNSLVGDATDGPSSARPLTTPGTDIAVEPSLVVMYHQYQKLLDSLAQRQKWDTHKLAVGEDIAYANMVACPSTKWVVTPNRDDPDMPVMQRQRAKGIVNECFLERRYFLRQLVQSLPAVILVFSQTTAREFISALTNRFTDGDPQPNESLADLSEREIRVSYGQLDDGSHLDARVIFMAHASANRTAFDLMLDDCVDGLAQEVERGNLVYRAETGHLQRGRGMCVFCSNSLYRIGKCDYEQELQPIALSDAAGLDGGPPDPLVDKPQQLRLLNQIVAPLPEAPVWDDTTQFAGPADAPEAAPLILRGTVVPMNAEPIANGAIYIADGQITAVADADVPAPDGFEEARTVNTGGVIYPGLFNLHNHLPYNIFRLWNAPQKFKNRARWRQRSDYWQHVSEPASVVMGSGGNERKAATIRYVEVKLLLGGVTSAQGLRSRFRGKALSPGVVRSVEAPDHTLLPRARTRLGDIVDEDDVAELKNAVDTGSRVFFHLAEGVDDPARMQFTLAHQNRAVKENLVGIHSLALTDGDHQIMREAKSWVVWSPLSNLLLYGKTIDPKILVEKESLFTLGSDWTPSGSRNILMELKVAWLCIQQARRRKVEGFSFEDLAKAVTISGATAAGWQDHLGTIEPGKLADFVVLDANHKDPYKNLVYTTERHVRFVMIGGVPRYGDTGIMQDAGVPRAQMESLDVGGRPKQLHLHGPKSPLTKLTFKEARDTLETTLADLEAVRNEPAPLIGPLGGEPEIEIELDMQPDDLADLDSSGMARPEPLPDVPLDAPTVIDDPTYFDELETFDNLPAYIKGPRGLRRFYQR